jgi:hypothetical protein
MKLFILGLMAWFLIKKLISLVGKGYKVELSDLQMGDQIKNIFKPEDEKTYTLDEKDKEYISIGDIEQIQNQLNIIVAYMPNFKVRKFFSSVQLSIEMLCSLLDEISDPQNLKDTEIEKLKLLVEESYIKTLLDKKELINSCNKIQDLKINQIYTLSSKAFIMLKSMKLKVTITFTKNLRLVDPNWYLSKIESI